MSSATYWCTFSRTFSSGCKSRGELICSSSNEFLVEVMSPGLVKAGQRGNLWDLYWLAYRDPTPKMIISTCSLYLSSLASVHCTWCLHFSFFSFYWIQCKNVKNGGPEENQLNMKMSANFIQFVRHTKVNHGYSSAHTAHLCETLPNNYVRQSTEMPTLYKYHYSHYSE